MQMPRSNMYNNPPEIVGRKRLHYIIVQVSKHRYVVAEYEGQTGISADYQPLSYITISERMKYWDAVDEAKRLTLLRMEKVE
jgi:hypothetical protein